MSAETPLPPVSPEQPKGLPPVEPPTARFIAQLFVVPALIVTVLVVIALGGYWLSYLFGGLTFLQDPRQLVENLKSPNPEVRWRNAANLADILTRDEKLAADPTLALELTQRLQQAMADSATAERALLERVQKPLLSDPEAEEQATDGMRAALKHERKYTIFLASCVGNCTIPVGASSLAELATREDAEAPAVILRKRQAVWALATLGDRMRRFKDMPEEQKETILGVLTREKDAGGDRGKWAGEALALLKEGKSPGVEGALARCARSEDPYLRKNVALALIFWEGPGSEATLLDLTHDNGEGTDLTGDPEEDSLDGTRTGKQRAPRPNALYRLEIRYQALMALAMRGSPAIKGQMRELKDMLDESKMQEEFEKARGNEPYSAAELASLTVVGTLKGVGELHQKNPTLDLSELRGAIDNLAESSNPVVRRDATALRIALDKKSE